MAAKKLKRAKTGQEKDKNRPANVARTRARHDRNRENQAIREAANKVLRAMGEPTPWEWARKARAYRRRYVLAA